MMIRKEMLIIQAIICFVSAFACRVYIWGARPLWQNWARWSKYLNLYVYPHIKDIQWQGASCRTADTQILNAFQGQETWRTPMKLQASCGRVIQDPEFCGGWGLHQFPQWSCLKEMSIGHRQWREKKIIWMDPIQPTFPQPPSEIEQESSYVGKPTHRLEQRSQTTRRMGTLTGLQ